VTLRVLVVRGRHTDDGNAELAQLGHGREVEAAQVVGDQRHRPESGGGGGHEVGQIGASADDLDLAGALEEGGDAALPLVAQRREDPGHEPCPGTGTSVNRACLSTNPMTVATLSRGTRSCTDVVELDAPNRPLSWVTGVTLTRSNARVASR